MNYSEGYYSINPTDINIDQTDLYKYLCEKEIDMKSKTVDIKRNYLVSRFKFEKGTDTVSYNVLGSMNWIIDYYFNAVVKPLIRAAIEASKTITGDQKNAVRNNKHYTITNYPTNWQELPEYQNFRNSEHSLCCFVEVDNGITKYLTTSVY